MTLMKAGWLSSLLNRWTSDEDRKFLYPDGRFVGTILTTHPVVIFLLLSASFSVLLFVPARILNLHSIVLTPNDFNGLLPCSAGGPGKLYGPTNVGILYKLNWSLAYPLLIPLIFSLAAASSRSVRKGFMQLVEDGTVQSDSAQTADDGPNFVAAVKQRLERWNSTTYYASMGIAILASLIAANIFSRKGNLFVYLQVFRSRRLDDWYTPCVWDDLDWMHAWTLPHHQGGWWAMLGNLGFYVLAEFLQGFVIFVASLIVLRFFFLTQSLASTIIDEKSGFHFEPFISDPDQCLGLRPLGRNFSMFLLLSLIFQLYAFGCRLQLVLLYKHLSVFEYFKSAYTSFKSFSTVKDTSGAEQAIKDLLALCAFRSLNHGLIVILLLMMMPVIVISWWPVIRLRDYVSCKREEKLREFRFAEREARQTGKYDVAKHLSEDMEKLSKASIWPNGFKIGWGFFFFLFTLLLSTFFPPFLVPMASGGLGVKILNKIIGK